MKRRILSLIIATLVVISGSSGVFAEEGVINEGKVSAFSTDKEIVEAIEENGRIDADNLKAYKLQPEQVKDVVAIDKEFNLDEIDAYRIERKNESENIVTVVAEMSTPKYGTKGYVSDDKDGRVAISAFLKYDTRTFNTYRCGKGVKYGGRVLYKQAAASVTKLAGKYNEYGAGFKTNGSTTLTNYTNNASFSTSNLYNEKSKSISRSVYVQLENGVGTMKSNFTATYKIGGNTYNITLAVSAS